jgi:hypothetical protein
MKPKNLVISFIVLGIGLALVAGVVFGFPFLAQAQGPDTTFTYQGRLLIGDQYVDGVNCDFWFGLYGVMTGGIQIGTTQPSPAVPVTNGYFTVHLDFGDVFTGPQRYLQIAVQCPPDASPTALSPRVALHPAPYAIYSSEAPWGGLSGVPAGSGDVSGTYPNLTVVRLQGRGVAATAPISGQVLKWNSSAWAPGTDDNTPITYTAGNAIVIASNVISANYTAGAGIIISSNVISANFAGSGGDYGAANTVARSDHNHFGQTWSGNDTHGLRVNNSTDAVNTYGFYGDATNGASGGTAYGVYGQATGTYVSFLFGNSAIGVYGKADVSGALAGGTGVYGEGNGVFGTGVMGKGNLFGVQGTGSFMGVAGMAPTTGTGVYGQSANIGVQGVASTTSGYGGLFVNNAGGILLAAKNDPDSSSLKFKVDNGGNVYADGGYNCGKSINDVDVGGWFGSVYAQNEASLEPCLKDDTPADFAEMLPAAKSKALEPGDVLVVDANGALARSSSAYQPTVVGVYSARPSYLGNSRYAGKDGYAPLSMAGIVPVKASAENGPIRPGDLLAASNTPGHAMRCVGVEHCFGRTIGKALGGLKEGTGVIQMLVMLQ